MRVLAGLLLSGVLVWGTAAFAAPELEIVNLRVGQGDATLILGPPNAAGKRVSVLFDAGDEAESGHFDGATIIAAVLARRGIRTLDYVIVSHYDLDHIGGLAAGDTHGAGLLLGANQTPGAVGDDDGDGVDGWVGGKKFFRPDREEIGKDDDIRVGTFVDRGDTPPNTSQAYQKYRGLAESMGIRVSLDTQAKLDGYVIDLGSGATLMPLAGNGFVRGRAAPVPNVTTENERSLSFLLAYGDFHFLISGDMIGRKYGSEDAKVEAAVGEMIAGMGVIVDVLHVDHHGANNGSDTAFLDNIKPTIAVISSGNDNDYHHPHKEALARLEAAQVYRIVQTSWGSTEDVTPSPVRKIQAIYQSDVVITSDGASYTLSTARTFRADRNPRRDPR